MPTLKELTARVKAIPNLRNTAALNERLTGLLEEMTAAEKKLAAASAQARHTAGVFPDAGVRQAVDHVQQAAQVARKLAADVANRAEYVMEQPARDAVIAIGDHAGSAPRLVRDAWDMQIQLKQNAFAALAEALLKTGIDGSAEVDKALASVLRHLGKPPATPEQERQAKSDLEVLSLSVDRLGLDEPARWFLIRAARGEATLADAAEPAVRKMLDRYPRLANVLRVRLG
jgi:hypothetical protein